MSSYIESRLFYGIEISDEEYPLFNKKIEIQNSGSSIFENMTSFAGITLAKSRLEDGTSAQELNPIKVDFNKIKEQLEKLFEENNIQRELNPKTYLLTYEY